ncbi:MAG TPA: tRNA (adenosine(37)-N6)-threonylcarbamoyltransferase complex dimerization subunit type 1 TsaB [Nocardioidaceae bacterium]|nr:tRNA (adenosine(37)-N6)-threonylcarbamoyltransferase complex dimerization subunit type 1 TsaB [Nocardioidaceae bacterium]
MLLAFDTSTAAVTVALHDGRRVVAERTVVDPLRHGEQLAPGIAAVLSRAGAAPSDVSRIAVGVGPGPFTGLRVGLVTARTLGETLGVEVVGVCSLDILAADVPADGTFLVATDARRKEVYWRRYRSWTEAVSDPAVDRPGSVATAEPTAGLGPVLYPEAFPIAVPPEYPSAATLATLVSAERAILLAPDPLYLRRPDVAPASAAQSTR